MPSTVVKRSGYLRRWSGPVRKKFGYERVLSNQWLARISNSVSNVGIRVTVLSVNASGVGVSKPIDLQVGATYQIVLNIARVTPNPTRQLFLRVNTNKEINGSGIVDIHLGLVSSALYKGTFVATNTNMFVGVVFQSQPGELHTFDVTELSVRKVL